MNGKQMEPYLGHDKTRVGERIQGKKARKSFRSLSGSIINSKEATGEIRVLRNFSEILGTNSCDSRTFGRRNNFSRMG